jgi:antagonist of KipI
MDTFEIIDGGLFTTVQDLGRYGYQRYGVPVSGAMDLFALRAANLLVGNPPSSATLEVTLIGPRVRMLAETVLAVTGADLQPQLDGRPAPSWHPFVAPEGAVLSFGDARDGLRAYLAVAGGIDVPVVLGSRSTFTRGSLGGFEGRTLRTGDRIRAGLGAASRVDGRKCPVESIPRYGHEHRLRVLPGPQHEAFSAQGFATFLSSSFAVSSKSDRVGCRLEGPRVEHRGSADIVSDGIPFGAVQVAGDGLPMILLADRGTTGGYTKVATVISADLPRLAQALPGDRVFFREVSLADAHHALRHQEATLDAVARSAPVAFRQAHLRVTVGGRARAVDVGLVEQGRPRPAERVRGTTHVTHQGRAWTMEYDIVDAGER